ncbi:MAG TPA: acetyl-CoA C-acetyltransferase [Planctomycetota bacterium]|nr:acetyl-CoA C-acetyltransferase [Planctomycetota bacterium]
MAEAVLVSACRTPIGKFQGALSSFRAPELGAIAIREAVRRAGVDPAVVDEVIFGNVLQAGLGQNPARQAARKAGLPDAVPSVTINKVCGSGLKAVMLAAQAIRAGDAEVIVAGGMESMTNAPYLVPSARFGARLGHAELVDSMVHDGLWDIYNDFHMGETGELVAEKHKVTREDQDRYAAESHRRASAAMEKGEFDREIVPIEIPQKKGEAIRVAKDEGPRKDSTAEALAKLRPAFRKDGGTVTAGNASSINDGAAALVVMSDVRAKKLGLKPRARITGYASGGLAPEWVMMAPEVAIGNLCKKTGCTVDAFELVEINEAFSAASVALRKVLNIDPERLNVRGGAVALGHPIGASGARVLVTLLHALEDRGKSRGLASLCLGGGNAVALSIERA